MTRPNPEIPMLRSAVRDLLDQAVDERCVAYYKSLAIPVIDPETNSILHDNLQTGDKAVLELVFMADARAQSMNTEFTVVSHVAWAEFARKGIRRAAKQVEAMGGLESTRMFSAASESLAVQAKAYEDMHERRGAVRGLPLNQWTGLEYASRVAVGEIALVEPVLLKD